jgi:hypothetical protein
MRTLHNTKENMHRHEMQQINIYLNIYIFRILFFSKNRVLQEDDGVVGSGTTWIWWRRGLWMLRAHGGCRRYSPKDDVGQRCGGLGNSVVCTILWAWGAWRCCMLENGVTGLGMASAWSTASPALVGEDGVACAPWPWSATTVRRLRGGLDDGTAAPGRTWRWHIL